MNGNHQNIDFKLMLWRSTPKNIEALGKDPRSLAFWAAETPQSAFLTECSESEFSAARLGSFFQPLNGC